MMQSRPMLYVSLAIAGLSPGCERTASTEKHKPAVPVAFLERICGMGEDPKIIGGLVFAVWQDGTFVRQPNPNALGAAHHRGRLDTEQYVRLMQAVEKTIGEVPEGHLAPFDAPAYYLRYGDGQKPTVRCDWERVHDPNGTAAYLTRTYGVS